MTGYPVVAGVERAQVSAQRRVKVWKILKMQGVVDAGD